MDKGVVKMIKCGVFTDHDDIKGDLVVEAMEWFKKKVKVVRPITEDETKAFRMIVSYIRKRLITNKQK